MKLLIAGSRHITVDLDFIHNLMNSFGIKQPEMIISGGAKGIDSIAKRYAITTGVEHKEFLPDWQKYGKAGGPRRNEQMAKEADVLLLIWDGGSMGSRNMKQNMKHLDKPVYEVILIPPKED